MGQLGMFLGLVHNINRTYSIKIFFVWTVSALFFYRNVLINFYYAFGDDGDGRLIPILSTHWFEITKVNIFKGNSFFFYPQDFVIGYSDLLVGFFPINLISWILDLDIFRSLVIYVIILSFISFIGIIKFIEIVQKKPISNLQLIISSIAVFGNGLGISASTHPQLYIIFVFPWLLYFYIRFDSITYRILFGLLFSIVFLTSVYIFIFSLMFFILFYLFTIKIIDLKKMLMPVFVFLIFSSLGIFYYYEVYKTLGPRSVEDLVGNIPPFLNLFNVSESNLIWGDLVTKYGEFFESGFQNHEYALAVTPILFISTFITVLKKWQVNVELKLLFIGVFFQLLTVKILNFSLWSLFIWFPVFDVIRVIGRIQLLSHMLIALALAIALPKINLKTVYHFLLISFIFIENLNSGMVNQVNISQQEKLLKYGISMPAECQVFFAISSNFDRPNFAHQVDAMVISYGAGIPTLNGYSGNRPLNWELGNIQFPDYADRLITWINYKKINKIICQVDVETGVWKKVNFKLT